ncbi:DUF397 domain-containing protein [Streptomyces uncialis]|uniref:DUF397 domain-containing protein n=1 Tax=Streptomyces uncialis TaxID=1048205 RepID=UPI0022580166|nr:DUF397 domain-containing protein [Streptomyces uncialis]MCX4663792.1 DUF397 domain-containing protein [Streptomyces uncialis]
MADSPAILWVKSSHSTDNGGTCVEWAPSNITATGMVPVRDSKRVNGPVLVVSADAFVGLVRLARSTEL